MITKRVILSLCLNKGQLTRTKWFRPDRWYTLNYVDLELADEIVLLDVTRYGAGVPEAGLRSKFWATVREFSRNLFVPLSVGGWLRTMDDVRRAFDEGADKVVVNTAFWDGSALPERIARKYGNQALVASLDCKDGMVFAEQGARAIGASPAEAAAICAGRGAGESLVMDISRDGSLQGYNLGLIRDIARAANVPLIVVGGCGNWGHMVEAFEAGTDACATQVIHHLTDTSLRACKGYLAERGVEVRI